MSQTIDAPAPPVVKKKSVSQTGHAMNVANFETLLAYVAGYGAAYNPSNAVLQLLSLQQILTDAQNSLLQVNEAMPVWKNAIDLRESVFEGLSKLVTRIVNAVEVSGLPESFVDDVKTVARKLQGKRAKAVKTNDPDDTKKTISASQMGFDDRLNHFQELIQLLESQPAYAPNETDLQVVTLQNVFADMKAKNSAAVSSYVPLDNKRLARNAVLYTPITGLVDRAEAVKKYVKSAFGADSPQYAQIRNISFRKEKI
jgi:exonuclease VII small subunit